MVFSTSTAAEQDMIHAEGYHEIYHIKDYHDVLKGEQHDTPGFWVVMPGTITSQDEHDLLEEDWDQQW